MNDELIQRIDDARRSGLSYDAVHAHLEKAGIPNPKKVLADYSKTLLPDGRRRGQMNPGDPHEQ